MAILGGSPLGLIGVKSAPEKSGMSNFNGGLSRNTNVNLYNSGKEGNKEKLSKSKQSDKGGAFSLFTGGSFIKSWPNIKSSGVNESLRIGTDKNGGYLGVTRQSLHNNSIYDTSILNIVEKTAGTAAALRPADFAYLRDIGVYPNNRLVIARRFGGAAPDDIYGLKTPPHSILITWKKETEDFLDITFGEDWVDSEADFSNVLNKITEDLVGKKSAASITGGLGAIPLPGWTESLQRQILSAIGVYDDDPGKGGRRVLPAGDPNLIKIAKKRKTIASGDAGSGLTCTVSVKMECVYEQKFISGIDPTLVWQDILANILRFGTSPGTDYGLSDKTANKMLGWVKNPSSMITAFVEALTTAIDAAKEEVMTALKKITAEASDETKDPETTAEESDKSIAKKVEEAVLGVLEKLIEVLKDGLNKTVQKYQEDIKGIINALTLNPSTPWHVTIGNPLRPSFCAGDMYTTGVTLTLGPTLAFNDLPSSIKADFTLSNARPWGLQEISAKFNAGNLRTVNVLSDGHNLLPGVSLLDGTYVTGSASNAPISIAGPGVPGAGNSSATNAITGSVSSASSKAGIGVLLVNSDPNSPGPLLTGNLEKSPITAPSAVQAPSNAEAVAAEAASKDDPAADANATSKRGYTYNYEVQGQTHRVVVKDKEGKFVANTGNYDVSGDKTKEILISDAKKAAGDV
jgi:hypothetical protein